MHTLYQTHYVCKDVNVNVCFAQLLLPGHLTGRSSDTLVHGPSRMSHDGKLL